MSEVQQKILKYLSNRGWTSRKEVATAIEGKLPNTVSVLNRMDALGTIEYADIHEFGRDLLHHVKITKQGLSVLQKNVGCVEKEESIKKADLRNKLHHIRDEIDKVIAFFNE